MALRKISLPIILGIVGLLLVPLPYLLASMLGTSQYSELIIFVIIAPLVLPFSAIINEGNPLLFIGIPAIIYAIIGFVLGMLINKIRNLNSN